MLQQLRHAALQEGETDLVLPVNRLNASGHLGVDRRLQQAEGGVLQARAESPHAHAIRQGHVEVQGLAGEDPFFVLVMAVLLPLAKLLEDAEPEADSQDNGA